MKNKNMNNASNKVQKNATNKGICRQSGSMKVNGVLDFWWASLLTSEKMLAMHVCFMMQRVHSGKRIEIRRELGSLRAKLVSELQVAEPRWLQARTVGEVPATGRN